MCDLSLPRPIGSVRFTLRARTAVVMAIAFALSAALATPVLAEDEWTAPADAIGVANPTSPDAGTISAGQVVYEKRCTGCHGTKGNGDGPDAVDLGIHPAKFSDMRAGAETDGALFWKIQTGRKPMPKYGSKLTADQIWQVIRYLRTLEKSDG